MSSYKIWEANVSEATVTTLLHSACGTTTCTKTITGLTNGTAYSYQIIAVDTDGNESAGSTAASVTPAASSSSGGGAIVSLTPETPKTATATPTAKDITDIAGHWAKTFIEDLLAKKVISGTDATHYSPNKPITRAEFTKIAINMFNIQVNNNLTTTSFKDVKTNDWFAPYVEAAYGNKIIAGYKNNLFKPNQPINRAEAVKILFDAAKIKVDEIVFSAKFPDVKNTDWYAKYVEYAAKNKIVNGYENGMFNPSNNITRAEAAKIASLLLGLTVQAK
jgi:chitodextrinase